MPGKNHEKRTGFDRRNGDRRDNMKIKFLEKTGFEKRSGQRRLKQNRREK
jgi:hypothetical protein